MRKLTTTCRISTIIPHIALNYQLSQSLGKFEIGSPIFFVCVAGDTWKKDTIFLLETVALFIKVICSNGHPAQIFNPVTQAVPILMIDNVPEWTVWGAQPGKGH